MSDTSSMPLMPRREATGIKDDFIFTREGKGKNPRLVSKGVERPLLSDEIQDIFKLLIINYGVDRKNLIFPH
jgi:hypothetical protein